jgi:Docking domain of Afi1 for Arf3 in vesicle trafficking
VACPLKRNRTPFFVADRKQQPLGHGAVAIHAITTSQHSIKPQPDQARHLRANRDRDLGAMSAAVNVDEEDDAGGTFLSDQAHVDYILTAEFDVDAGPIISHQYPEPLGGDVS